MADEATPPVEAQVEAAPLSDLPVAQPYNAPPVHSSEPVVSHPPEHQQAQPPEPAPVYDPRRNRYVDPTTQKIVRDPSKWVPEQVAEEPVEQPAAVEPPATVAPVAIQHTPVTLHLARQLQIPEHVIAATPTADLRAEIALLQGQPAPQARPAPVEEPIDWGEGPDPEDSTKTVKYTEANYAPAVAKAIRISHNSEQEIKRLKSELQQERSSQNQQRAMTEIESVMSQHPEIYGSGTTAAIDPESKEGIARDFLLHRIGKLLATGRQTTPAQDAARIHAAIHGGKVTPPPVAEPTPTNGRITPEQWQRSGLAPTAHRNTAPLPKTRRQQVAERVDDEMRRNGIKTPAGSSPSDLSDLPPR